MNVGFIKLHRQLTQWEWYTDQNTFHLFIHCLLKANYEDKNWRGIEIKTGSFITSLDSLSNDTGLSVQQVRTALKKLILTNEVTSQATNRSRLITVVNYSKFQTVSTSQPTGKQQTDNKQITTTKEVKKEKTVKIKEAKSFKQREKESCFSFEDFWKIYDYSKEKKKALAKYSKIIEEDRLKIKNNLPAYITSKPDKQFRKHPATWLNQECWNDEIINNNQHGGCTNEFVPTEHAEL